MAANQQTMFEKSLDLFRRELSDDQIKQVTEANQKTVTDTIQEIQKRLGSKNGLCKLTRVQSFLHAMEETEKLVTIFLNASDFVAFIWGPIKLALMIATTWTDAVRQLIDAYEEIAEALNNLAFFHKLIQSQDRWKLVLEDYFSDILRFHRCVLDVFSRPEWKRVFKFAWGTFRREVKPILKSLKNKEALLSDDKLQSHAILKEVQDSDQYARGQFSNLETALEDIRSTLAHEQLQSKTSEVQGMKNYLESRLDVSKSRTDLQLESRDSIVENSGSWIFTNQVFKCWEEAKSSEGRVLFLNGSPGSGKSTMAKTIIRHEKRKQASELPGRNSLAYFFFKHDAADRRTARSMLQHLIMQLVNADETLMRFAYSKLSTMESTELGDLKKLASDCFTSRPIATLVLDGLDEAIENECKVSIAWCLDELLPAAKTCRCELKILICGQMDGKLEELLSPYPGIRLDHVDDHQNAIGQFTRTQAAKIRDRFLLGDEEEKRLISKVSGASRGMFLYARVVLDNLAAMDSTQEFEDELESNSFPENIDQAYDRIAQRILTKHGSSRHKTVKKILGWVVCAARPLRWREIQSRFCIDADQETCNIRNLRRDSCKRICSSLVDVTNCDLFPNVETEQVVSMVHQTATEYLFRSGTVNLLQEHTDMALFCCRYLSSRPCTTGKHQDITTDIQSGYFGFLDYAAAHYAAHIQKVAEISRGSATKLESVQAAAVDLAKAHGKEASIETGEIDKAAQDLNLAIQGNVLAVRNLIGRQREKSETAVFDATEGPLRHKCQKLQCTQFATGFSNEAALEQHLSVHERPFRCPHDDCFAHAIGYASQRQLESHNETFHHTKTGVKATFPTGSKTSEWNLYEACKAGDLEEVKRFHREGADLNGATKAVTPLCAAAEAGHGPVCKYLVDNGIDPFRYSFDRRSSRNPITDVIKGSHLEILELFLYGGNVPDDTQLVRAVVWAINADHPDALNMVLTIRQPRDHVGMIKLVPGEIIRQAVEPSLRSGPHSSDATLIHTWFRYVKPEFYNDKGVFSAQSDRAEYEVYGDMFFRQHDFFKRALYNKSFSLATFLMDIGNDEYLQLRFTNAFTPLHVCIDTLCRTDCINCMSMIRRLLQYDDGKFANITDGDGSLPAHRALNDYSFRVFPQAVLRTVFDNTGDINHRDNSGRSPLHLAKSAKHIHVLLENKSVDLFSRNNKGQTAFSALIDRSYVVEVEVLDRLFKAASTLAWTPDESEEGLTPLHYALRHLESDKIDSYILQRSGIAAKFLLTCSEVKQVLVEYQAKSTEADRNKVRDFAEKEMLREALDIMDSIWFVLI